MGLLLNAAGELVRKDMEKADVLIAFFALAFADKTGLRNLWSQKQKSGARRLYFGRGWECLSKLDTQVQGAWCTYEQCRGSCPLSVWLTLLTLKGHGHQGNFLRTRKTQMSLPSSRRAVRRIWRTTSQAALLWFFWKWRNKCLQTISRRRKDEKVLGSIQHGLTNGKLGAADTLVDVLPFRGTSAGWRCGQRAVC